MQWHQYLDELEAQFDAQLGQEILDEARQLALGEAAQIGLIQRLRAAQGECVGIGLRHGGRLNCTIQTSGADWISATRGADQLLIPVAAMVSVTGLDRAQDSASLGQRHLTFGAALRRLCGAPVTVTTAAGQVHSGWLGAVWADHLDLAGDGAKLALNLSQLDVVAG